MVGEEQAETRQNGKMAKWRVCLEVGPSSQSSDELNPFSLQAPTVSLSMTYDIRPAYAVLWEEKIRYE